MGVLVRVPTPLRRLTNNQDKVEVEASTIGEFIDSMESGLPRHQGATHGRVRTVALSSSTST